MFSPLRNQTRATDRTFHRTEVNACGQYILGELSALRRYQAILYLPHLSWFVFSIRNSTQKWNVVIGTVSRI